MDNTRVIYCSTDKPLLLGFKGLDKVVLPLQLFFDLSSLSKAVGASTGNVCKIQAKLHTNMASLITGPPFSSCFRTPSKNHQCRFNNTSCQPNRIIAMQTEKPLEELYNVRIERKVSQKRLDELGVSRWSVWKTGKCKLPWDWQVDQLVYVEEGEVRVVPEGSKQFMRFVAGDLVRYPKWFEADLFFNGPYQERYSFRAYGDD